MRRLHQPRAARAAYAVLLALACGDGRPPLEPSPITVTIEPAAVTLLLGTEQTFSATVTGATNNAVTFGIVEAPAGGTITAAGEYTAPAAAGTFRVRATSVADASRYVDAVVTVRDYLRQFERVGDPARAYDYHTATLLADGSVLVVGGLGDDGIQRESERYVPAQKAFAAGPSLATARMEHAAARLADGRVLVTGGWDIFDGGTPFDFAFNTSELYDPATSQFAPGPAMSFPRRRHVATPLADGRVLLTGGIQLRGTGFGATPNVDVYDPATNQFTPAAPLATGRWLHTAVRLANGRVLVVGGLDNNCVHTCFPTALASAELFDPATNTFAPAGQLQHPRYAHSAALLPDGRVIIVGGENTIDVDGTNHVTAVEVYNPATGTFSVIGATTFGRAFGALAVLNGGRVLIAGGWNANTFPTSSTEIFDPSTGASSAGPGMLDWRMRAAAIKLPNGEVLVVGGNNTGTAVRGVEVFR